jgi:hypothetical protein
MNTIMAIISVAVVIGIFAFFFLKVVKPMMSGGRAGVQNQMIQKYIDDYNRLARTLQCDPPAVPQTAEGYKGWPVLTIKKDAGTIVVTPTTDYWGEHEQSLLYRSPYGDPGTAQRIQGAAMGQAAMSILDAATDLVGTGTHHHDHQIRADQLTTIRLQMPASWKGSMILVRPETLMGKLTSLGEVSVNNPPFDRAFKVNGSNAARVQEILTPRLCEALLRFKDRGGKFQLNENTLICAYVGLGTDKVPNIVNELLEIAKVVGK